MSNVKFHHFIVIVGVEDGQVVSTEMSDSYEDEFPNGTIWNPQKKQWEYPVDDEDDESGKAEYDTPNLTNDIIASDYVWNAIKRGTEN